jgi:hypothetical protein
MESEFEILESRTERHTSAPVWPRPVLPAANRPRWKIVNKTIRIFDPDHLRNAFDGGQIEHRLLEPGMFTAKLIRIVADSYSLQTMHYSLPVTIDGSWAAGRAALVFGLNVAHPSIVHARPFRTGSLAVLVRKTRPVAERRSAGDLRPRTAAASDPAARGDR